ncbi:MAG TPA: hypothetical protein VFE11_17545, partial [Dongiaceae bacterium]|nr:hypothetical protein [Dongiaceae bacterium]
MTDLRPDEDRDAAAGLQDLEADVGVSAELLHEVKEAIEAGNTARLEALVQELHPADVAALLEQLTSDERAAFVKITGHLTDPETLSYLDD